MQAATVCCGHAAVQNHPSSSHQLHTPWRPAIRIAQWPRRAQQLSLTRRTRISVVAAAGGTPKADGFSGRDFLAEFDELFKSKPAEKEQQPGGSSTSSARGGLSEIFKVEKRADESKVDVGSFKNLDNKPKPAKVKKERITKKFFASSPGKLEVKEIVDAFKMHEDDVGSSSVQIALLSQRIKYVAAHLKENRKDFSSRRGLRAMVEQRKKHLIYLRRTDMPTFTKVIAKLGLRDNLQKAAAAGARMGR